MTCCFKGLSLTGESRHGRFLVAARAFQKGLPPIRWTQEHLALNGDILPSCESYKKRLPAMQAVLRAVLGKGGGKGEGTPFFRQEKVPFPPQTPPILPKTAHMLFCPTGQSLLRNVQRPKKSGKNAAGNDYFVSKAPARQVSVRRGGREDGYPPLHPRKETARFPHPS